MTTGTTVRFKQIASEYWRGKCFVMQALFDFCGCNAPAWAASSGLSELHAEGFDTEQIWGQLETSCGSTLKLLRKKLKGLGQDFMLLDEETEAALDGKQTSSNVALHTEKYVCPWKEKREQAFPKETKNCASPPPDRLMRWK